MHNRRDDGGWGALPPERDDALAERELLVERDAFVDREVVDFPPPPPPHPPPPSKRDEWRRLPLSRLLPPRVVPLREERQSLLRER